MITEKPIFEGMQFTTSAFIEEFWKIYRKSTLSMAEAYELTEEKHMELFNSRRYSGYDSFRVILNRKR